jgi:hypothetical protein
MKEALGFSETSVLTRDTRRNIPEDTILHSHRREDLKSYILYIVFVNTSDASNVRYSAYEGDSMNIVIQLWSTIAGKPLRKEK